MANYTTRLEETVSLISGSSTTCDVLDALQALCKIYNFDHSVFHIIQSSYDSARDPIVLTTYPEEWVNSYVDKEYFVIDPVVQAGRGGFLPVDWCKDEWTNRKTEAFWRQADSFGVGRHGVTLPVRGPMGQRSLFTATSNARESIWFANRALAIRDLQVICHYLHQKVMQISGLPEGSALANLSKREKQCMLQLSRGRLPKQIAADLQISERSVRVYLTSARAKLGATTTNQAMATFVSMEIA